MSDCLPPLTRPLRLRGRLALLAPLALAAGLAGAQPPGTHSPTAQAQPPAHAHGGHTAHRTHGPDSDQRGEPRHAPPRPQADPARRLAQLKQALALTPAQESAWAAFAQAMQAPAPAPVRPDRAALEKMSTPERLDHMQAMHQQQHAAMEQRMAATRAFYATLSPEQQKRFDTASARMMAGHKPRHHAPHHRLPGHPDGHHDRPGHGSHG